MALTVTNLNTLSLLNILNRTSTDQSNALLRLSTGQKINRGADSPSGLIALKSIESELTSVNAGITNNQRTDAVLSVTDKSFTELGKLMTDIQRLADETANDAGLSADEVAANQAQIDDAISSIDRIVQSTQFNGQKLLDGSLGIHVSGVDTADITDVKVFNRSPQVSATTLSVTVQTAASRALLTSYATTSATADTTISVQGADGTAIIEIASTENLSSVAAKINEATGQTGVSAYISSTNLHLRATDYGTDAFVRVNVLSGDTTNFTNASDEGSDAVVRVNGQAAAVDGKTVNFASGGVSVSFELTDALNQAAATTTFSVTDGGATFQLGTNSSTRATIGIDGLFASQLGNADLGYLSTLRSGGSNSLVNDPTGAARIAREAGSQLAKVQGRIGGFQKFQVKTALNSLNDTREGLEKAHSVIGDVDYATETAELNRQNVLLQSAISLLGLANQQSSQVLSLLR